MLQWEDGTISYFSILPEDLYPSSCGQIQERTQIVLQNCNSKFIRHFLCQKDEAHEQRFANRNDISGRREFQAFKANHSSVHFPHTVCPSGHLTLDLLACDVQSHCWEPKALVGNAARQSAVSLCQAPLLTLFTCRRGVAHVPYSLVCDHSPDCLDASDEDFCVHPSCSIREHFECINKQVKKACCKLSGRLKPEQFFSILHIIQIYC